MKSIIALLVILATSHLSANGDKITISFVGDVNFTGRIDDYMSKNGHHWAFDKVRHHLSGPDFTVANLESPAGIGGYKYCEKRVYFKANPKHLDALVDAGVDMVSLANNHALDYGPDILKQTIGELTKRNIKHVGIVNNNKEKNKASIIDINGVKVAFLAYCNACPTEFGPRSNTAGVSVGLGAWIKKQIKETRGQGADIIVAMSHWGSEYFGVDNNQRYTCRMMREAGADIVIGHHPHVLQQVEFVDKTLVAWSLGNFIFPMRWQISLDSAILNINIDKSTKQITYNYIPISLDSNRPEPVSLGSERFKRISFVLDNGFEYNNNRKWPEGGIINSK
jgi:poly-gamma-glutamate synthesis protein (capsule biosynthesis protein)